MLQRRIAVLAAIAFTTLSANDAHAAELRLIDAHSQFDRDVEPERIVPMLDRAGISHVILSTRRGRSWRDVAKLARDNPNRVTASVRTKGRHYQGNKKKYYRRLKAQLNDGVFGAMSETILWHAEKGRGKAPEVIFTSDAPQVQAALKAALDRNWPFVVHIEFRSAKTAGDFDEQMQSLTSLLERNPDHPFALTHLGQLSAGEAGELIEAHPNIHFLTSHANERFTRRSRQPWTVMVENDTIVPAWRKLVIDHPTRFVFAIDNVWDYHWSAMYVEQVRSWRKALQKLPPEIAHSVAHKNAERLWRVRPVR